MKKLIEFIVNNHTKFEYGENGKRITNLEYRYPINDDWDKSSGKDFDTDYQYRITPKLEFTEQDVIDFVEFQVNHPANFNWKDLFNAFRESRNAK